MKICITSQGDRLESEVDPRFVRCAYFIIVDPETLEFEAVKNISGQAGGGAGIQSGQLVSEKGVKAVLTGNVGPNAFQTLKAADIDIITGINGKVSDAISQFVQGDVTPINSATVESHFGFRNSQSEN